MDVHYSDALGNSFVWDAEKEKQNIKKHNITFKLASRVWADADVFIFLDRKHSLDEERYTYIGMVNSILSVVSTERESNIRIITARKANAREKELYYEGVRKRLGL